MTGGATILFAHGARDPEWAQPFRRIKELLEAKQPGVTVVLAFLEMMEPSLADAAAQLVRAGHTTITIAPLFMAQGGHLKNDVPKILATIRAAHPGVELTLLPAIGDVDPVLDAIAGWLVGATAC
jgi:sirohydrochlorin cobaltochelatase